MGSASQYGESVIVRGGFIRPDDSLNYSIGDTVGIPFEFPNCARALRRGGFINYARLLTNQVSNNKAFRLWLYSAPMSVVPLDNKPIGIYWVDNFIRVGHIDIDPLESFGTESTVAIGHGSKANLPLLFNCTGPNTSLYGVLEVRANFSPTPKQEFVVDLFIDQN